MFYDGDARSHLQLRRPPGLRQLRLHAEFQVTPAAEGTLQNTATVTSGTLDPNAGNNQATATTTVVAPTADLSVEKKSAPSSAFVGEPFDYESP